LDTSSKAGPVGSEPVISGHNIAPLRCDVTHVEGVGNGRLYAEADFAGDHWSVTTYGPRGGVAAHMRRSTLADVLQLFDLLGATGLCAMGNFNRSKP
jgi:hypothetical protein